MFQIERLKHKAKVLRLKEKVTKKSFQSSQESENRNKHQEMKDLGEHWIYLRLEANAGYEKLKPVPI